MVSPSIVVKPDGTIKHVKNLGWLLSHWHGIDQFCVTNPRSGHDALYLVVRMQDGSRYETGFADLDVFQRFVARPVFIGCDISSTLFGYEYAARKVTK